MSSTHLPTDSIVTGKFQVENKKMGRGKTFQSSSTVQLSRAEVGQPSLGTHARSSGCARQISAEKPTALSPNIC